MGEAIARFREMALAIRRHSDQRFSEPRAAVSEAAASRLASRCRRSMRDFEAGRITAERYAHELRAAKRVAELSIQRDHMGQTWFPLVEWLPPAMKAEPPSSIKPFAEAAVKEALAWDSKFSIIEPRIRALARVTTDLHGPGYDRRVMRWQEAFDALAPFVSEQPAAPPSTDEKKPSPAKQAKRRSRKGIGGRPEKFPLKFIREVVKARERYLQDAARLKQPVLRLPEWLSDYFSEKSLPLSSLPSRDPKKPEEWSIRANRFWKAAKQRLSRFGN